MNQTLPTCARCSNSFWPSGRLDSNPSTHLCETCEPSEPEVALSADETFEPEAPTEIIRTKPKTPPANAPAVQIAPRQLPGDPPTSGPAMPIPTPAAPRALVFNCPACMAVLNIARDLAIAGTTAPCPHCASMVIPPRIAPAAALKPVKRSHWRPER